MIGAGDHVNGVTGPESANEFASSEQARYDDPRSSQSASPRITHGDALAAALPAGLGLSPGPVTGWLEDA